MATTVLLAGAAYTPSEIDGPVAIVVRDGLVAEVLRHADSARHEMGTVIDVRPWRVVPGYIDLHTHGFAGHDVTSGTDSDLVAMRIALPATGVTAFLPTIGSTGPAETQRQVERVAAIMRRSDPRGAEILGIRLEGPFINRVKKGAQDESAIRPPDHAELRRLAKIGPIRIVDFAPEEDGDFGLLQSLLQAGILASVGHTAATYDQTLAAIDAGVRHCTHLFNAMPPLEHRGPGAVGALLADPRATVELIADGVHVHPAILRLAWLARGPESVALVTDAMSAAGLPPGDYTFLGRRVSVRDGAVRLLDGTLAGSVLTMDAGVRNLVQLAGASWANAIRMATLTPATIAGVADRKGQLTPGADADLVVLDDAGHVRQTWRGGQCVYESSHVPRPA